MSQNLRPSLFEFEPVDYNTSRGIDIVARNKTENRISESTFWYVELKHILRATLDHGFKYLRWIVCWDFDKSINRDTEFAAVQEADVRTLENGRTQKVTRSIFSTRGQQPSKYKSFV